MYKFLLNRSNVTLKLTANSIWLSGGPRDGRKNAAGVVQGFKKFATFRGHGSEPIRGSMQENIVNALSLGERNKAFYMLSELGQRSQELQTADFVHILQYCARKPDPLFVIETWKLMEEKGININSKCCFLTIRALCNGGYLKEAFDFVRALGENYNLTPTLPVYNNLLQACVERHNLSYASDCLYFMEHQMVGRNERTYTELLKFAVLQQNLSAVREIWEDCVKCYSLSIIMMRKFIWSFSRLKDLESAYAILQHMVAAAFRGNFNIGRTTEGKFCEFRLDVPIPSQHDMMEKRYSGYNDIAMASVSIYKKEENSNKNDQGIQFGIGTVENRAHAVSLPQRPLSTPVMKILRWSFSDVIQTCANMRNAALAEQLIIQMQNLGLEPSRGTYDGFIRAILSVHDFRHGMKALKVMQQKNMEPHASTIAAMSISCSRSLELDLAEAFLDQIFKSPHAHPYNAFLQACDTLNQPERAVWALAKMKKSDVQPDVRTYELLFSLFGNVNAPYEDGNMLSQVDAAKRINAIEMDMMKHGIQHNHLSMKNLLKALGTEGMIRELIQYLRVAENQFSRSDPSIWTPIYNTVLHSLVEAKESHMAKEIFKSMVASGCSRDSASYNIMIDCCSITKCFSSALALLSVMIRDGFYPHAVTYTALIKILLEFEDFDEALKLLDQGRSEGIEPDVLLYNTIFQVASEKGRIDIVELIVEQMHQDSVLPDPSTCSYVFSAYVNNGFHSTAMEALQVLSMRMISEEGNILDNRMNYEDLIFSEDLEAEPEILEAFNESKDNLAVGLLYLRWCATLGYPISWLPNQSQWAAKLSRNYISRRNHL